jgi:four helix bundle protein
MARKIEELPAYERAIEFCAAINAILDRPGLCRDRHLRDQIASAADSITANMHEGFEQPTDRAFAKFLFISKASLGEVLGRLRTAHTRRYITGVELGELLQIGDDLGRMLGGFIRYLYRSDFKDRGRHDLRPPTPDGKGSE